ncbi:MAG: hypothetical protein NVSMB52_13880 [Chloroflexota bacterium]
MGRDMCMTTVIEATVVSVARVSGSSHTQTIQREFSQLAHRYSELANSLSAQDQRERSSLQDPLMKLYIALHPGTGLTENDDIDVLLRSQRRQI